METMTKEQLISELTEQTQILKAEYLLKMGEYAIKQFAHYSKISKFDVFEKLDYYGITYTKQTDGNRSWPVVEYIKGANWWNGGGENYANYRKVDAKHGKVLNIVAKGFEVFAAKMEKLAILHYEGSIQKLAFRILAKKLDLDKITMATGRVGVNIETVLTDGKKTVKAWTIVASGEVQQPHYRYLVK